MSFDKSVVVVEFGGKTTTPKSNANIPERGGLVLTQTLKSRDRRRSDNVGIHFQPGSRIDLETSLDLKHKSPLEHLVRDEVELLQTLLPTNQRIHNRFRSDSGFLQESQVLVGQDVSQVRRHKHFADGVVAPVQLVHFPVAITHQIQQERSVTPG